MTPDDVSFWSMIGTWVAGLATTIAVITSLWLASSTRKPKVTLELSLSMYGDAVLKVINTSELIATIDSVTLVKSKWHKKKHISSIYNDLIKNPLMKSSKEDVTQEYTIHPNGHFKEFSIYFHLLHTFYNDFLPYDGNGHLTSVVKMPLAYVLVKLVGNHSFYIQLPHTFFTRYKEQNCSVLEKAFLQAIHCHDTYVSYVDKNDLYEKQQEFLDLYMRSKRNSLYLIL
ncbi:hypothetical protein [Aeromonas veronii]|uniref:hypothetical protein n=1 Tax=Aeromonas veronii TaxID=654 RepID=UPI0024452954|nr:hypothetical protein [Aeromonas veronii]